MFSRLIRFLQLFSVRIQEFLKRDPDRFHRHLIEQSLVIEEGLEYLVNYMEMPSKNNAKSIRKCEKAADEIRRIVLDDLNITFVTPIDREDISALSRDLDDVLDYAWSTVNEMDILDVEPNEHLLEMAKLIRDGGEKLRMAVERLHDHPRIANEHAVRALSISGRMEELYSTALADLFDVNSKKISAETVIFILKLRESYRHMFRASRSVGQAANTIGDIVVKFF